MMRTTIVLILGFVVLWGCRSTGVSSYGERAASGFDAHGVSDSMSATAPVDVTPPARFAPLPDVVEASGPREPIAWETVAIPAMAAFESEATPMEAGARREGDPDAVEGATASDDSRWDLSASVYLWLASRNGHVTTDLGSIALEDPEDSAGIFFYAEGNYERWGFAVDVAAMSSDDDADGPGGKIDMDEDTLIVEADVTYRPIEDSSLQFLAGLRVFDDTLEIDFPVIPDQKIEVTQWDPVVGAQGTWELVDSVHFRLRGDVGGFGVDSDFTYQGLALLAWEFLPHCVLTGGYRLLGYVYDEGDGENDWRLDGVLVGLAARF